MFLSLLINLKAKVMRLIFLSVASLIRVIRPPLVKRRSILIPSVQFAGSVGDQAMLKATITTLRESGSICQCVITESSAEEWNLDSDVILESIGLENSIEYISLQQWRFLRLLLRYNECFIFGADVLDGGHGDWGYHGLLMADLAHCAGLQVTVLGCSINEQPSHRAVVAWQKLDQAVRVCVRDPISLERLQRIRQYPAVLVADVAFLLRPVSKSTIIDDFSIWFSNQATSKRTVVAFNLSAHFFKSLVAENPLKYRGLDDYVKLVADIISFLSEMIPSLSIVLTPHDVRGKDSDVALNEQLVERLRGRWDRSNMYLIPGSVAADEVKAIAAKFSLVITARMHLAIASLGQSTPCVCMAYQGKFEGLLNSFEVPELLLTPQTIAHETPKKLAEKLTELIFTSSNLRQRISNKLPEITELAKLNFK